MTENIRPPVGGRKWQGTLADLLEERDESDLLPLEPRKAQAHKAQLALAHLLGEQGLYCGQDDLVALARRANERALSPQARRCHELVEFVRAQDPHAINPRRCSAPGDRTYRFGNWCLGAVKRDDHIKGPTGTRSEWLHYQVVLAAIQPLLTQQVG
jgi:hypothetical protein